MLGPSTWKVARLPASGRCHRLSPALIGSAIRRIRGPTRTATVRQAAEGLCPSGQHPCVSISVRDHHSRGDRFLTTTTSQHRSRTYDPNEGLLRTRGDEPGFAALGASSAASAPHTRG